MPEKRIKEGAKFPSATVKCFDGKNIVDTTTDELLAGKIIFLFGVPGAFTPTCTNNHLASYLNNYNNIKHEKVDGLICLAVNDIYVLRAWAKSVGSGERVTFISDGNVTLTSQLGLTFEGTDYGFGTRSSRFSMIIDDGIIKTLSVEEGPGECTISGARATLELFTGMQ